MTDGKGKLTSTYIHKDKKCQYCFTAFVFYCGTEVFSFTSNMLNGREDIAHKYHKDTAYYFHWKRIFYIRYYWMEVMQNYKT